jgi:3-hydroxyisobutyrate dehydrogenase-like beta-hydroxyacid dehydrogenase
MATAGFIGLGNMGAVLAANLVERGFDVIAFDAAGPERVPGGASAASSVADVARRADVVVLSLPDGNASEQVARGVIAVAPAERRTTHVVDTSTIGISAAQLVESLLAEHDITYVDAPVSGGVAGAKARTLNVMYAGSDDACRVVEPVLAGLTHNRRRVGDRPGLAQAMKLANNFLSATALIATSEAIAFGRSAGLDMTTMLEVINASSGRSAATEDKFPNEVVTEKYASGFANSLMAKDMRLYLRAVQELGGPAAVGELTASVWQQFAATEPGVDFTRIFPFVERQASEG